MKGLLRLLLLAVLVAGSLFAQEEQGLDTKLDFSRAATYDDLSNTVQALGFSQKELKQWYDAVAVIFARDLKMEPAQRADAAIAEAKTIEFVKTHFNGKTAREIILSVNPTAFDPPPAAAPKPASAAAGTLDLSQMRSFSDLQKAIAQLGVSKKQEEEILSNISAAMF